VADGVVDDEEYLEGSGLDVEEVEAAGDRDPRGSTRSGSKQEIVKGRSRALEQPTEEEVVAYAGERGVSTEYVREALEKLARRGVVSESRGQYRLM